MMPNLTPAEINSIKFALGVVIEEQRKYEHSVLNYTKDSALVGGWVDILAKL